MLEALLVSNVVLWVLVVVLTAVVLALVRQIGVLHERVAPAGALMTRSGPQVGEPAPHLDLADWSGRPVAIGGNTGNRQATLLLFVSPTCPVCKTMLSIVDSVMQREHTWLRLVLASDGVRAEHEKFVRDFGLSEKTYILSTDLGVAYQVPKLPYAVLIDANGVLRAKGLVNTREHVESLFEAMERGVESVQEFVRKQEDARRVA
ncbi:MAG: methylamine dehydrogenase accessory protein MauD [Deltaproteobacteria bacterium]|nr:methylamine dehydrogenase accessory protein MauD [Deltaproteobacteria bacterium]